MTIALFDLDNTLIKGDSDYEWGNYLVENSYVDPELYQKKNNEFFQQYKNGTICPKEFALFSYEFLAMNDYDLLLQIRKNFFDNKIFPLILPKAQELVKKHQKNNDIIAIVTSTNSFISRISADFFNIQYLLASEPEIINNRFTGRMIGEPCYQEGKVLKVKEWIILNNLHTHKEIWFYTDSFNDIKLMEFSSNPVSVDPDNKLKDISIDKNWPIISLR